jgi:hypothetical protein
MPAKKGKVAQVAPGTDPTEGECVFVHLFGAFLCFFSVRFCAFVRCVFVLFLGAFLCFLTQVCCEQMTMTKMLSSLR